MTSLSRILITIIIGIFAAVIGAVLYLSLADLNKFKPNIEAAISDATGREFRINGELQLDALPSPSIVMEDVTFENAEWGSRPAAVEIGHLSAEIALLSLLSGPIEVKTLHLSDASVLIEADDDGTGNFDFESGDEKSTLPVNFNLVDEEIPLIVNRAEISNVTITRRRVDQEDQTFQLTSLSIEPIETGNPGFEGKGNVFGLPLTFNGEYSARTLDISIELAEVKTAMSARIADNRIDVELVVDTLDKLGAAFGTKGLPTVELNIKGTIVPGSRETELRDVSAVIGEAKFQANGKLSHSDGAAMLTLSASVPNLQELSPDLPALSLTASTTLKSSADELHFDELDLTFGDSDLSGEFHLTGGEANQIEGEFTSRLLDLTPFMATEEAAESVSDATNEAAAPPDDEAPTSEYVFVDAQFDFDKLQYTNVKLQANVGRLIANTVDIRDLIFASNVVDGTVDLRASGSGKGDGRAAIELLVNTEGKNADLHLLFQFKDLNINIMSGDVPAEQVPSTDLTIDVSAKGSSPHALASSANGRLLLTQGPGTIANDMIGKVSGDIIAQLFTALNPFAKDEEFSNWDCTVFSMNITDGVSEIDGFLLQGQKIQIVGAGSIDLTDEKINIEFNTKPRTGVGLTADSFVTPFVKMSGTLMKPGIGLNEKGVLISGSIAVATAGISLLVKGAADRATAGADACVDALAAAGEHAAITEH